jgi:hypothetical protein
MTFQKWAEGDTDPVPDALTYTHPYLKESITVNLQEENDYATLMEFAHFMEHLYDKEKEEWSIMLNWFGYYKYRINNEGGDKSHIMTILLFLKHYSKKAYRKYKKESLPRPAVEEVC